MRKIVTIALLGTLLVGASAFAADPVVGKWELDVGKSKFTDKAPKSVERVYAETADGTTLDQKMVGADGKESTMHLTIKYDGKDYPVSGNPDADTVTGKRIDGLTTQFTLKKGGKVVGTVHRVVSADSKTLSVNNKGTHADGKAYNDMLEFEKD
jgi:hypothetical protein